MSPSLSVQDSFNQLPNSHSSHSTLPDIQKRTRILHSIKNWTGIGCQGKKLTLSREDNSANADQMRAQCSLEDKNKVPVQLRGFLSWQTMAKTSFAKRWASFGVKPEHFISWNKKDTQHFPPFGLIYTGPLNPKKTCGHWSTERYSIKGAWLVGQQLYPNPIRLCCLCSVWSCWLQGLILLSACKCLNKALLQPIVCIFSMVGLWRK